MKKYPPDRWINYCAYGVPIKGTRLLPIKLPIPEEKSHNIPAHQRFSFDDLIAHIRSHGQTLTCVIDLTYTQYYNPKILCDQSIKYYKIFVEGHKIPEEKHIKQFISIVNQERKQNSGHCDLKHCETLKRFSLIDGIIAVHCTHGVNRTGYFLCRYLIDVMDIPPIVALQEFEQARGHPVERENYIDDLSSTHSAYFEHDR